MINMTHKTVKPNEVKIAIMFENRCIKPYKITGMPANAIGIPRKIDMICRMYGDNPSSPI
jgi:hypothetical protein